MTTVLICLLIVYSLYLHFFPKNSRKELLELMKQIPDPGTTIPMSHFRQVVDEKEKAITSLSQSLALVEKSLAELKSQQQSKSVRLGQISEQVLPFHAEFPYDYKKLKPLFQPIDYIYFGDLEIVFIEMKMGTSQLSENQKYIRRLIQEGKVRFEEHTISEKGYKIK
jgi:predicted Holliday junction resolvase-like endonuclease